MAKMRAKYKIDSVTRTIDKSEIIKLSAVTNGTKEDNTFHQYTPYGNMDITITNPTLLGIIEPGQKYYLDFTLADE
jgi:hypothetical protein